MEEAEFEDLGGPSSISLAEVSEVVKKEQWTNFLPLWGLLVGL